MIPSEDDIQFEASCKEEYERYCAKTPAPLIYEIWKAREEDRAKQSGIEIW